MKKQYEQVKQFHAACGVEMPDKPTMLDIGDDDAMFFYTNHLSVVNDNLRKDLDGGVMYFRTSLMLEELIEFMDATTIEDQADALIDLMYFAIGTFTLMGLNPEPIFNIVANANLGKVMPDGTVLRDEQGKIMKPDGWKERFAPEAKIRREIQLQGAQ